MPVVVLMEDGEIWERETVWLLGGGVAWGRHWLGLRLEEEEMVVGGRGARVFDGWRRAGGVASGSGLRFPGGVAGGKEADVSRRVWLPSGDCGVLSSLDARRPFWY